MEVVVNEIRRHFGRDTSYFSETPVTELEYVSGDPEPPTDLIELNPSTIELDTRCQLSAHSVNTSVVKTKTLSLQHREGGWPKDIDPTEKQDVGRFRKKAEKDDDYKATVKSLGPVIERAAMQNNTIDIYEEYFDGAWIDHSSEPPSAKGLAVFRDPESVKRTASSIDWQPESNKLAVTYSVLTFQDSRLASDRAALPMQSYIWDVANPNTPEMELIPTSPLCCLRYNPKIPEHLMGGSYNGLISFFDVRKSGSKPCETSVIENSHHDPVYDAFWISSKTGNMCASVSTDGQMLWWDTRRLREPVDRLQLNTGQHKYMPDVTLGGSSMEYNQEAGPTKYLVGTEQGVVMSVNLRNKKQNNGIIVYDTMAGRHHGPICSIQRNPVHPKFFMTVGDWTAKIWMEDLKTPIMTTKYHPSYLTAGCWSPTRPGVFFVTRKDGVVDIWDYFYRQNEVAYSHKVSDSALSSISLHQGGQLVGIGDVNGTVSLLQVCDSLSAAQSNEKLAISGMMERETKREKNLEARSKELARKQNQSKRQQVCLCAGLLVV
jgi:dynein intermediate chain 2